MKKNLNNKPKNFWNIYCILFLASLFLQLFGILFFLMLFVLGIGSLLAFNAVVNTTIRDAFPKIAYWKVSAATTTISFLVGIIYVTPVSLIVIIQLELFIFLISSLINNITNNKDIHFQKLY